ncbi:hypothetical protein E6O75_ATG02216 [Venturia nashicola]|uniref:BTB domain-containing protein n=1 Tax=Venturia nashicola TaxID=86259 RepID=A0A4Z1PKZ2_9PEZI|nr:hypothetical protein E6O75_ATG02216 [Venturia nashicola]
MKRTADLADLVFGGQESYADLIAKSQCTCTIKFKVGSDGAQEKFHVPEVLLVRVSDVLKDQFKDQLGKSTSTITFSYISPTAFSEFLFWLYHQDTHGAFDDATASCYENLDDHEVTTCIVHLCILASNWQLRDIHNRCIQVLDDLYTTSFPDPDLAIRVYDSTKPDAPLREYITMILQVSNTRNSSDGFLDNMQGYLKYSANDSTWSDRYKDYHSELFRLGSFNGGKVVGSWNIEPVPFEEYFIQQRCP